MIQAKPLYGDSGRRNLARSALFLILILVLITHVFGAPPSTLFSSPELGLTVLTPNINYIKQNENHNFHVHVYNSTNGQPIVSGVACDFHLYNSSGEHISIISINETSSDLDFEFMIGKKNFSKIGTYSYLASCNSSGEGGFISKGFEVTEDGLDPSSEGSKSIARLFNVLVYLGLSFTIGGLIWALHKWKEDRGAPFVYGMLAGTISFITAGLTVSSFQIFKNLSFIIDINYYFTLLYILVGIYSFVIGYYFYQDYNDKKYGESNPYG